MTTLYAALLATLILAAIIILQLLVAAGLPLGKAVWGGAHSGVLPARLRLSSLAAAAILALAAWMILARSGILAPGPEPIGVRIATWVFAGFFVLNTLGNVMSKSPVERKVMTPATVVLALCFALVSLS